MAAPRGSTWNSTATSPAFSKTSVAGTFCPASKGAVRPMNITCAVRGSSVTVAPGAISIPSTGSIRVTPCASVSTTCRLTSGKAAFTATSLSGALPLLVTDRYPAAVLALAAVAIA